MKSTQLDANGDVRCPVCGARQSFTVKRTGKAKWAMGIASVATLGVAAVAAPLVIPKRLKCNGCGENLKRGSEPYVPRSAPVGKPAISPEQAAEQDAFDAEVASIAGGLFKG